MAEDYFGIRLDTKKLEADAENAKKAFEKIGKEAEEQSEIIDKSFTSAAKSISLMGAAFSVNELVSKIGSVRGEFQQLEVAFTTILGSEEKAFNLMNQLVKTAATTPFDLQSVAQGAKQLLAFGENAEKVNEDLIRLGNIAAGLSIPLGDLVYLYGTTMTQGRLYTQDFNQFTSRGIPMIKELAKEFGVAENEVKGLVEAGRVGFPEVQKVIQNLTNEGGMFFELMEKQSKTITGQLSNIEDSFSMIFNDIGKANEGLINDALSGFSYLLDNYQKILETIMEIAVVYGTYKAALVAVMVTQKAYSAVLAQAVVEQRLAAAAGIELSNAQAIAAARTKLVATAFKSLSSTLAINPYTAITAAVAALGYGIYKVSTYQTEYEKGVEKLNESVSSLNTELVSEQRELAQLKGKLDSAKKGSEEYNKVKEQIVKGYGKYFEGLDAEIEKVGLTEQAYNKLSEAIRRSAAERQFDRFKEDQLSIMDEQVSENLEKIQKKMIEKLGDEEGAKYYSKLRDALLSGSVDIVKGYGDNVFKGIDQELQGALNKVSGKDKNFFYTQDVEKWMKNIIKAQNEFSKLEKDAKKRFGIGSEIIDAEEVEENAVKTYKTLDQVVNEIKKAEKTISDLRKKSQKGLIGTGDVDQELSKLDTLKKTYKSMTGEEYGKKKITKPVKDYNAIKEEKDYAEELQRIKEENENREIEIMKDGTEKQIAEINLRYSRELEAVKKLREAISKEQGGKLTVEQAGIFDTAISGIYTAKNIETEEVRKKQADQEKADMQKYLSEYGNYWEKRKAITEQYQEKITAATTKWSRMSLQAEMTEALAKLDDEAQKKTSIITQLFGNMSKRSVQDMRNIADEAERMLEFIEGGEYDKNNAFGITEEQFKVLSQSPEKLESIKNEIANVRTEADRAEPIFERIKDQLEDIFNSSDTDKLSEKLRQLTGDLNEVMQVAGFLSDVFNNLGDSFGSDVLSGIGEGLNTAMNTMNSALQGAQAGSLFGPIGAAAGAAVGVVSSLSSAIAKIYDNKREKEIQKLQSQIEVLTESYETLGREVERAYSKDASNLIEQQNELLEQQKVLIESQIKEEKDKKKTDNDRIKQWEEQLDSINQQLEENKEKAIDVIFGEDIQAAIEDFSSAMTDAWSQGVDASESAKDSVRRIMQQMVTESIKQMISASGKMEEIRKKLQEFYADEVLTGWEQDYIYNMADELQQQINDKFGWAEDLFKDQTAANEATSKGFQTMSQDSADELNGRFTALNETGIRILNKIDVGNIDLEAIRNNTAESRDIIQSCYGELIEIRENTAAIVEPIKKMQKDMNEMKNTIKEKL